MIVKTGPKAAVHVRAGEGAFDGGRWAGAVSGETLDADILMLFIRVEDVGGGPSLHLHPYDEVFVIREGRARFRIGDRVFDAEEGDVVMGPATVPHRFENLGPGPLSTIDIHLSRIWIQTDLEHPSDS